MPGRRHPLDFLFLLLRTVWRGRYWWLAAVVTLFIGCVGVAIKFIC